MPIGAGFVVAYLQGWGFSPALKFLTRAIEGVVDDTKNAALPTSYWQVRSSNRNNSSNLRQNMGSTAHACSGRRGWGRGGGGGGGTR
jgi:hypothetical protein